MVTVSEERLASGLLLCLERAKQVMESAGAAGVAALFEHSREFVSPAVVALSGGNIDPLPGTRIFLTATYSYDRSASTYVGSGPS